jgi:hypothetical protein
METFNRIATAIEQNNIDAVRQFIQNGFAVNASDENGAPILFHAIMQGDLDIIRLLLEKGADPNFIAQEPPATIYLEKALDLAQQLQFLIDWDKYHPIAGLLQEFGATGYDGQIETPADFVEIEQRARQ